MKTGTIGYPRIGAYREMKKALEEYWSKKSDVKALLQVSNQVFEQNIRDQHMAGIDVIGIGSHTMYDNMLDWTLRFGLLATRFQALVGKISRLDLLFSMARGCDGVRALDMTKWYDTNYHNLSPEIQESLVPRGDWEDYLEMIKKAVNLIGGNRVGAEVIGPITIALKSKLLGGLTVEGLVHKLIPLYSDLFKELKALGVAEVQIGEPALVLEKVVPMQTLYTHVFTELAKVGVPMNLVTFFDDIGEAFPWAVALPGITTISLDFTRGDTLSLLKRHKFPADRCLGAGIVDGRSIWKDISLARSLLQQVRDLTTAEIRVQPSCSLMHCPYDVQNEREAGNIPEKVVESLSFARQKLEDVVAVANIEPGTAHGGVAAVTLNADVEDPVIEMLTRSMPYEQRRKLQLTCLADVTMPTSTIGSFPQTSAMRKIRLAHRKGDVSGEEYRKAVDQYIAYCIGVQEGIGLDVLVHGEPERSDMVEFFAEKMTGFLFTQHGWVQSYGSRYVRPPVIYGDVSRNGNNPMTVREFIVAQNSTNKPVKGMLTGPTTILNWSFPRKDVSRKEQAFQIALALRDEVADLETAGCSIVQVDEPALREGLPLKSHRWVEYLDYSVKAFKLVTTVCRPETHVLSHFCYSEFEDVMDSIKALDADQITMENSRSNDEVLRFLVAKGYDHDIAPGVYDIHSPVVPTVEELQDRLKLILNSGLRRERLWIVPDCGLKTRKWEEVVPSLRNLVAAVTAVRMGKKI